MSRSLSEQYSALREEELRAQRVRLREAYEALPALPDLDGRIAKARVALGLALAALAAQFADILTQVRERDWSALMDTIGPLVAVVVFFCAVTLALNLLAAALGQKQK